MFKSNDLAKLKEMGFQVKEKPKPKEDELCEVAKQHLMVENVFSKIAGKNTQREGKREIKTGTNEEAVNQARG